MPICCDKRAESQKAAMTISSSPSHLLVWPNSTSNVFPVGGIRVPFGSIISPVKLPVARVTTVIQSPLPNWVGYGVRSEEHTSELQSQSNLVCRLLLEKKKKNNKRIKPSSRLPLRWSICTC